MHKVYKGLCGVKPLLITKNFDGPTQKTSDTARANLLHEDFGSLKHLRAKGLVLGTAKHVEESMRFKIDPLRQAVFFDDTQASLKEVSSKPMDYMSKRTRSKVGVNVLSEPPSFPRILDIVGKDPAIAKIARVANANQTLNISRMRELARKEDQWREFLFKKIDETSNIRNTATRRRKMKNYDKWQKAQDKVLAVVKEQLNKDKEKEYKIQRTLLPKSTYKPHSVPLRDTFDSNRQEGFKQHLQRLMRRSSSSPGDRSSASKDTFHKRSSVTSSGKHSGTASSSTRSIRTRDNLQKKSTTIHWDGYSFDESSSSSSGSLDSDDFTKALKPISRAKI